MLCRFETIKLFTNFLDNMQTKKTFSNGLLALLLCLLSGCKTTMMSNHPDEEEDIFRAYEISTDINMFQIHRDALFVFISYLTDEFLVDLIFLRNKVLKQPIESIDIKSIEEMFHCLYMSSLIFHKDMNSENVITKQKYMHFYTWGDADGNYCDGVAIAIQNFPMPQVDFKDSKSIDLNCFEDIITIDKTSILKKEKGHESLRGHGIHYSNRYCFLSDLFISKLFYIYRNEKRKFHNQCLYFLKNRKRAELIQYLDATEERLKKEIAFGFSREDLNATKDSKTPYLVFSISEDVFKWRKLDD